MTATASYALARTAFSGTCRPGLVPTLTLPCVRQVEEVFSDQEFVQVFRLDTARTSVVPDPQEVEATQFRPWNEVCLGPVPRSCCLKSVLRRD